MTDLALDGSASLGGTRAGKAGEAVVRRSLSAEVHAGPAAYRDLRGEWEQLARLQRSPVLFQMPALLDAWAQHFAADAGNTLTTVVVRRDDGRAVLIWPLVVERNGPVRIARGAGTPFGQYDELLLDPECDAEAALAEATAALNRTARPDLLFLERVRADSALHAAIGSQATPSNPEGAPFSDVSGGTAALFATLKSRVVQQQKKRIRRFEQEGSVGFEVAADPVEAERWLMEAMTIKREWLRMTGRFSRAFAKSELADLLVHYARTLTGPDASPRMVVSRLTLDGRTAAVEMGFRHGATYHLYLGAFSADFAKFGPGNILTEKLLHWCAENGIARYDMLAPRSRNKSEWQSAEVEVCDFTLPTTWRGRLYVAGVVRRFVPAARGIFYRLPVPVRSALAGFVLRRLGRELGRLNSPDREQA